MNIEGPSPIVGINNNKPPILRNIALTFVFLTVVLAAGVIYLALGRAIITVHLGEVDRPVNFVIKLAEEKLGQDRPVGTLAASFYESKDSSSDTFLPSGTGEKSGKAGGTVVLHNETSRDQPLVATTRLLTTDGKLFRLESGVKVPAKSTITAMVAADKEGAEYEIGPSRFTIPGLNQTLQQSIYATSSAAMIRGAASDKVVTLQDLEMAKETLKQRLLEKARTELQKQIVRQELSPQDMIVTASDTKPSVKAGELARSFTVSLAMTSVAVVYDRQAVIDSIRAKTEGVDITSFDQLKPVFSDYDSAAKTVILSGVAQGQTTISADSSIFDSANFVGMRPNEVENFLKNYDGVTSVKVDLSPYWINKLPKIPGRIQIRFE